MCFGTSAEGTSPHCRRYRSLETGIWTPCFRDARPTGEALYGGPGLGIVDVIGLFGVTAVGDRTQVELVVTLEHWNENKVYNRTGLDEEVYSFHNERIPYLVIPVAPGRNILKPNRSCSNEPLGTKVGIPRSKRTQ